MYKESFIKLKDDFTFYSHITGERLHDGGGSVDEHRGSGPCRKNGRVGGPAAGALVSFSFWVRIGPTICVKPGPPLIPHVAILRGQPPKSPCQQRARALLPPPQGGGSSGAAVSTHQHEKYLHCSTNVPAGPACSRPVPTANRSRGSDAVATSGTPSAA